jgi:DNA/RNA-binding domain of Phe-tRNA-synthetase-like protein
VDAPGDVSDPLPVAGWVEEAVREELPALRLLALDAPAVHGSSAPEVRTRLRALADRFRGSRAVALRTEPVPQAYRQCFRQIGLDPDTTRTPVEEAAVQRLVSGGYEARSRVEDAQMLALVETGVPVWALDAAALDGPLGIRQAQAGDRLGRGEHAAALAPGRLVVADAAGPVAILFGHVARSHAPTRRSTTLTLFTIQVAGVPAVHVQEALWVCVEALAAG